MMILKKFFWLIFGIASLLLREIFKVHPSWTEKLYSRGIFQGVRFVIDYLLGWLPFPLVYILFGVVLWRIFKGGQFLFFAKDISLGQRLLKIGWRLLSFLGGTIGLFYWLWGYNYSRLPIEKQLNLPNITLNKADLKAELDQQTAVVLRLRKQIIADTTLPYSALVQADLDYNLEPIVRQAVETELQNLHFPTLGRVRGRQPFWQGFLLRFGAAGIYNPFTGESNIDKGLYFLTKPYTLAHEFCHGYGFSDEGTCNFLAYLALQKSDNLPLRYAAELSYWREVAGTYRRLDPETYKPFRAQLPLGFRLDLDAINQNLEKYPEYFADFRYEVYDNYLKAQGISEGIQNYSKVIRLVVAWRKKA
ncbi:MAG: hypothetical protein RLZZ292_692 [Bacteroidota bacterium]|jgi:hypothetical protein